ncbi:transporter [Colwellia psychrerythraea]|uniref:Transporter n=1 Tax=Colwellia psychrerythraea TaxID=28229 RepID=A0A1Y5EIY3_COLPS|nr:transporter [Colwellia psychrerythraea]
MPTRKKAPLKPIASRFLRVGKLMITSLSVVSLGAFSQQTVKLNEAISYTLQQHPGLKSFSYMQKASEGMIEQASVSSPMTFSAEVEDAFGTGSYSGVSAMQTTLSISWLLEGDKIESRVNVANEKASMAKFKRQIKALNLAAETAKVFITLLSQKEQLKLAKLARNQTKQVLGEIKIRVTAGKLNVIDELRAKAELSRKKLTVEDLLHEIQASKAQLAAQWQGEADFIVDGDLLTIPTIAQIETVYKKLKSNPRLNIFSSQQQIAEAEIELAKVKQKPSWSVNTGIKRNEFVDDYAVTAGISIPFGSENRNRGKITALRAKQNQSRAESDALYQRISTQLLMLTHKLKHNRHVINGLSTETIPALELASIKAGAAYKIGRYRYTDWYAVQQELVTSQTELIEAYTNIHLFTIELECLTGSSISM